MKKPFPIQFIPWA